MTGGRSTLEKLPGELIDNCLSFLSCHDLCGGAMLVSTMINRKAKAMVDKHHHAEYMEERALYDQYVRWYRVMSFHNQWYSDESTVSVRMAISQICSEHSTHIFDNGKWPKTVDKLVSKDEITVTPEVHLDNTCTYKTYRKIHKMVRDISVRRGDVIKAIWDGYTMTPCGIRLSRALYNHFVVDPNIGFCYESFKAFNAAGGVNSTEEFYKNRVLPAYEPPGADNLTYRGFKAMFYGNVWRSFKLRRHTLGDELIKYIQQTKFKLD